jgi:hypothetical protein
LSLVAASLLGADEGKVTKMVVVLCTCDCEMAGVLVSLSLSSSSCDDELGSDTTDLVSYAASRVDDVVYAP